MSATQDQPQISIRLSRFFECRCLAVFIRIKIIPTLAHPGNTDSQSGHTNHKSGEYHFHTKTKQAVPKVSIQEKHWQKAFNDKVLHGELEYYVEGKRVDILTPHYAVEVDWLRKYQEGVLQALEYARLTGKRPGLAIILEGEELDTETFLECQRFVRRSG